MGKHKQIFRNQTQPSLKVIVHYGQTRFTLERQGGLNI